MREEEVVSVLKATLEPLLRNAGFASDGERWTAPLEPLMVGVRYKPIGGRWTSCRGDAIRSVDFGVTHRSVVLRAGIGFAPALNLIQSPEVKLDLSYETILASEFLQLYLSRGVGDNGPRGDPMTGAFWIMEDLSAAALGDSVRKTFQTHVLSFFEKTSTVDAALREVEDEGKYGDCGPMSYFQPRINMFFLAAFYKQRGDQGKAIAVVEKELAINHPGMPWPAFREWILKP